MKKFLMNKYLFIIKAIILYVIVTGVACATTANAVNGSGNNNANTFELNQLLNLVRTFSAKFTQSTYDQQGRLLQRIKGQMFSMKPNQFRWEALDGQSTHQLIITNGKILWLYDVDLAQATKQPLNQEVKINPATLLSGDTKQIAKQFIVTKKDHNDFVLMTKGNGDRPFIWMELKFQNNQLVKMKLLNNLGQLTDIQFSQIQINTPISAALFEFKPPKGVDVISNS